MYGPPGRAYVYLVYGFHFCVNAVCRPAGCAEAVLIRAIEAGTGLEAMRQNRATSTAFALTNGPGKLCQALAVNRTLDGVNLCEANSPLYIARNPELARFRKERGPVAVSARVGLTKAAERPLRFYLGGSPFLSRRDRAGQKLSTGWCVQNIPSPPDRRILLSNLPNALITGLKRVR